MKVNEILKRPWITEKTSQMQKEGYYAFEVDLKAGKNQIKQAVEELFGVEVSDVKIVKRKGKLRKVGRRMREKRLSDKKLAYVKLKKGNIDVFPKV